MDNLKICVIVATYQRKTGQSRNYLNNLLRNLESQTYTDFKLFLIGDHYDDDNEFQELCKSYKNEIYFKNNIEHYRNYNFENRSVYWAIGGGLAIKTGIEKAMQEEFNYYFHLDDDDRWENNHIELVVNHIKQFPLANFILTKARYSNSYLPRTNQESVFYNNYIPRGSDSVHASHIYKLDSLGPVILSVINNNHILANKINNEKLNCNIPPGDATLLDTINNMVSNNKIKSLYIPIITVYKDTDCNFPV